MRELFKRGNLVLGVVIGLLIAGLWWVSGHVWYVPDIDGEGGRYCIGSMSKCFKLTR